MADKTRLLGQGHRLGHAEQKPLCHPVAQRPPGSARPAPGGRFAPAGPGAALSVRPLLAVIGPTLPHGRGKAVPCLIRPHPQRISP